MSAMRIDPVQTEDLCWDNTQDSLAEAPWSPHKLAHNLSSPPNVKQQYHEAQRAALLLNVQQRSGKCRIVKLDPMCRHFTILRVSSS
mmetsp:Transcript_10861/g.19354  ORF Transcript_10861/g.19354 Transcript_10861/m.19354 type:complete len:87 (-) Transcript_10861:498-758(-)